MIITCGQCQAKFKVAPEQIKETGSKVRCSNCRYVFTVYRPSPLEDGRTGPDRAAARDEDLADDDRGFGDLFNDGPGEAESPRERRERRRQLYADLDEDLGGEDEAEDDDLFAEEWDEAEARPPLRRRRPAGAASAARTPDDLEDAGEDDSADGYDEAGELGPGQEDFRGKTPAEGPALNQDDALGLTADPVHPAPPGSHQPFKDRPEVFAAQPGGAPEARAAVTRIRGRRSGLVLGLVILCAALVIGIYYFSARPEPLAFSDGLDAAGRSPAAEASAGPGGDPYGIEHITFAQKDNLKHFYRKNAKEGEMLIITGKVRNSYPGPRSFIRLRGLLLDQGGATLADRFVYAGNMISEEDLMNLPKEEIMARLNIKGGRNNQNMNIAPGQEVPFMVVFDKLPPAKDEYRIIPVGSSPAE